MSDGTRTRDLQGHNRPEQVGWAQERRIRGEEVPPIGDRQIEYDLKFLWAVLNWATKTGDDEGNLLLAKNPLREFVRARDWPREKNPDRPSLTDGQYRQMLEAAASIDWRFEVALVLAHETGHRIGSIRNLRWSDLEVREGWVRWREENDKVEWEHLTPLTPDALSALRRAGSRRTDAEDGWVFPSPTDPGRPCSRNIMRDWWNAAQEAAGLGELPRLGWHSLRRKFANDLRHVPLKDLAALGGWKDTQTLLRPGSPSGPGGAARPARRRAVTTRWAAGSEPEARHYIPIRDNRTRSR